MEYNKNAPTHLKCLITTPVLEVLFKARKLTDKTLMPDANKMYKQLSEN